MTTKDGRSRRLRWWSPFIAVVMLASLGAPAQGRSIPALAAAAGPAMTTLTVVIRGCLGSCSVVLANATALNRGGAAWTAKPIKTRRVAGVVTLTFRVPRYRTKGMYFTLRDPKAGATGAGTLIVTRYKGATVGRTISGTAAGSAKYASECWAGTTRPSLMLRVTVGHFKAPRFPDDKLAVMDRPYFTPTIAGYGRNTTTWKGTVLVQDWVTCT